MKNRVAVFLSTLLLFVLFAGHVRAGNLDFAVIQPGQPGSETEARPIMDALADYLAAKMGPDITIKGHYFNRLEPALAFLKSSPPAWGIVQLGVYVQRADDFHMTPLASTRPAGFEKDVWRLVAGGDTVSDWQSLKGKVLGNMLFEEKAATCLLFGLPPDHLSFTLEGTFRPLRSLRSVVKGKNAGAVLDRVQYETVQNMSVGKKLKVLQTSRELPTSPVVWFGAPNASTGKLTGVLEGMKTDADAAKLLTLLQTDGFGPPDPDLSRLRLGKEKDACFRP